MYSKGNIESSFDKLRTSVKAVHEDWPIGRGSRFGRIGTKALILREVGALIIVVEPCAIMVRAGRETGNILKIINDIQMFYLHYMATAILKARLTS